MSKGCNNKGAKFLTTFFKFFIVNNNCTNSFIPHSNILGNEIEGLYVEIN